MPGENQTLLLNSQSSNAEELRFYAYSIVLNWYRVPDWGTHEGGWKPGSIKFSLNVSLNSLNSVTKNTFHQNGLNLPPLV